ncbi:MAG: ABC transporter permease [Nocardioidaceae bacterium]
MSEPPTATGHVVDPGRVPDAPLRPPWATGGLLEVFRRRYLLRLLVDKEIQARYQGSALGLFWSYVQPMVRFAMYFFVIGLVLGLHKDVPNFAIHMFAALVCTNYFIETFSSGTRSIQRNKPLVRKMAMPRELFPVSSMIVSAIHVLPQLLILIVAAAFEGYRPSVGNLSAFVLGAAILVLWATGLALLFSAANVFFRDFENIVQTCTLFAHWCVPLMYPWSKIGASGAATWIKELYLANPLAQAVLLIQKAFWFPTCDDPAEKACQPAHAFPSHMYERGLVMLVGGIVFLAIAQLAFSRLECKFADRIGS